MNWTDIDIDTDTDTDTDDSTSSTSSTDTDIDTDLELIDDLANYGYLPAPVYEPIIDPTPLIETNSVTLEPVTDPAWPRWILLVSVTVPVLTIFIPLAFR